LTDRANRRRWIDLELRAFFQHLAKQLMAAAQQALFHVAQILIGQRAEPCISPAKPLSKRS
jgi:hypothetical protein